MQLQSLLQVGQSFLCPALLREYEAQVVAHFVVIRIQFDGALQLLAGCVVLSQAAVYRSQQVVRVEVVRLSPRIVLNEREGLIKLRQGHPVP